MKENRSKLTIKLAAFKRMLMWYFLNKEFKLILVSEFPKSGGSWFSQLLSDALNIPFPRNTYAKFERCLMHGHYLHHRKFGKVICVMRDGRDVMVSAYYHLLFENNRNASHLVRYWRDKMPFSDYENIEKNLPDFITCFFDNYKVATKNVRWSDFVNKYLNQPNVLIIKYEDLVKQTLKQLERAIDFLGEESIGKKGLEEIVQRYSFKNLTIREPGQEDKSHFLRKGIVGDWRNCFSKEACEVFNLYAGEELLKMGYEKNLDWY